MGSVLEKISEIIDPRFIKEVSTTAIVLTDDDPQGTCKNTTLKGKGKILVCKFDLKGFINFPFFISGEAHEMCDYLLFYESNDNPDILFVFVCELQSRSKSDKKAIAQMRAGYNLASFLIQTACKILEYKIIEKVVFKGIRFSTRPPEKYFKTSTNKDTWGTLVPDTKVRYLEIPCGETYYVEDNFI
jgi:hypothetical protein